MQIKTLTLWEPWASLVAIGAKKIETRSWQTQHRGPLAIHASKRNQADQRGIFEQEPFRTVLYEAGYSRFEDLPFGHIVAVVDLTDIEPTEKIRPSLEENGRFHEIAFGDYSPGRFGWHLENLRR